MAAKRLLILSALVVLSSATGCRHWCERNYPCPTAAYPPTQACVPCVPCCPPGVSGYSGQVPPAPTAPVDFRSSGKLDCTCTPAR
jgi:hypothetical protein